jgi:uncharacterized membrane protein SirB2
MPVSGATCSPSLTREVTVITYPFPLGNLPFFHVTMSPGGLFIGFAWIPSETRWISRNWKRATKPLSDHLVLVAGFCGMHPVGL